MVRINNSTLLYCIALLATVCIVYYVFSSENDISPVSEGDANEDNIQYIPQNDEDEGVE